MSHRTSARLQTGPRHYLNPAIARTELHDGNDSVAYVEDDATARRLVACWNACNGLDTAHLENLAIVSAKPLLEEIEGRTEEASSLRLDLGEALTLLRRFHEFAKNGHFFGYPLGSLHELQAIIAKHPAP